MDQNLLQDLTLNQDQNPNPNPPVDIKQINKKIRNIVFSILALVFITVMFYSASSFAFFADEVNSGNNKITAGSLDMKIVALSEVGNTASPFENDIRIVPALTVSKIVMIKNTGTLPMTVRVKIDIKIDKDEADLPSNWRDLILCDFHLDDETTDAVEGAWVYRDGYYYYLLPLESNKTTTPLFESVTFSREMGNEFANSKIEMTVICEATQVGVDVWPTASSDNN